MVFLNPVIVVSFLWLLLVGVSNLSLTGIDKPSALTQSYIIFNVLFIFIGAFFYKLLHFRQKNIASSSSYNELPRLRFYYVIFFFFCFIPIILPLSKAVLFIVNNSYFEYLAMTRWSGGSRIEAFGSATYLSIINYFFLPFSYAIYFISIGFYIKYNVKKLLILSVVALVMYSFLLTSRAEILMILITMSYALAINNRLLNFKNLILVLVLGLFIVLLSLVRFNGSFFEMLSVFVINYHTYGFTMLDKVLVQEIDLNFEYGFGLYTFPFISIVVEQVSNIFPGDRFLGLHSQLIGEMSARQVVGVGLYNGELLVANSFYTVLLPLYADFRNFSFIFFFIYGYFLYRSYCLYRKTGNVFSLSIMIFLFFLGYNGLFFPLVMREFFWLSFFVLVLMQKIRFSANN